jgi:5'-nucleotidase/UDP-sugar diphosphatase
MKRAVSKAPAARMLPFALLGALVLPSWANVLSAPAGTSAPSATTRSSATTESHIVIFHSNDVHGKIDNFAKVAALLAAERKTGASVFYFSSGDNFTGDPVIDRYEPPGQPIIDLYARLGLDLLTVGNHEFDYGMERVRALTSRFPAVSANIEAPPGVLPGLRPWIILKAKDGIKILVFGLIQIEPGNNLPSTHPDKVKGLRFADPLAKALELRKLRSSADIMIALTHLGYDQDLALAKEMPELDLIIGGHSHTRVDAAESPSASHIGSVLLAQAGSDNRYLGRIELRLRDGRLIEKTGRLIDLGQPMEEDPVIKAAIAEFRKNPALARVLARAPFEISGRDALGSLATDAMRFAHGLDIAFQNNGGIRLNRLPAAITLKDAYTLDPFGNQTVEIVMTSGEIRGLIKTSFEKRNDIDLQVSGMTYVVRVDGSNQLREIVLRNLDGTPLAEGRTYRVGMSSYVASSYGFIHKDPGRSLQTGTVDDLIKYLESGAGLGAYRDIRRAIKESIAPGARN